MLAHYLQSFDTVELNNSFYRLPAEASLRQWREQTPHGFVFAVKGSRFLTHMKKLKDAQAGLDRFLHAVEVLEPKLGPILFQLPPNWSCDVERLREFLSILPRHLRYAFEFRNPTWDNTETYALLTEFQAAYCIFDLAGYQSPLTITTDFTYVRLHGPGGKYQGSYSDQALEIWADRLEAWGQKLHSLYVYFDNDDSGFAPQDAID